MKTRFALLSIFFTLTAQANPFSGLTGKYEMLGEPAIRSVNAVRCNRFNFSALTQIEIKSDLENPYTPKIWVQSIPRDKYSTLTIEYQFESAHSPGSGNYGKVYGEESFATYVTGFYDSDRNEVLTQTLQKTGTEFMFYMMDEIYVQNQVISGCYYKALLHKAP